MTYIAHAPHAPTLASVIATHAALRASKPLVQCLTNVVSANFMANVLLSAGAAPAMVDNPEEAADFARIAGAVLINLGTPTSAQVEGMRLAVAAAHEAGKPWVLDPIGAGGLAWRGAVAAQLLAFKPAVIRGNASEIIGLAGLGSDALGFDTSNDPAEAVPAAVQLLAHSAAVSASGVIDHVVGWVAEGATPPRPWLIKIAGGSAWLPRVTASGCSLGALVAAYTAVASDYLTALTTAHVHFALAAELAEATAKGPGSFAAAFLDGLDAVDADLIAAKARFEAEPI
ncbi:hydroxyethylthiazole kinase [Pseudomonas sp. CCC3.1]|uniref:hydroxyethylthiazole kinase n=1 Tax=Pseudomonas sp. CCC3.1 TaxID=3048607 RepID=UPI002AC93657|nr:hydroxyethylthiazole kinase [Pseudomonas sp. CCC3.1]MEB0203971.1 hydroxyethylthiazole kinase [Pseudomonas sp. CCC3.1]WPX37798.1 hydroxyethylthiazole kinase [Pseudomonas sp. CCC3.1]